MKNEWAIILLGMIAGISIAIIITIHDGCINNGMFKLYGDRYLCESME